MAPFLPIVSCRTEITLKMLASTLRLSLVLEISDAPVNPGKGEVGINGHWGGNYRLTEEDCKATQNHEPVTVDCYYDWDQTQNQNFLKYVVKIPTLACLATSGRIGRTTSSCNYFRTHTTANSQELPQM